MAIKISERANVPPFIVMDVMNRALEMDGAPGPRVLHLEAGQPSTPASAPARRAMIAAMDDPASHAYAMTMGVTELREAIAAHYREFYGHAVDAGNIIITVGSSQGFSLVYLACFEAGERVAMCNPGYPGYANLLHCVGLAPMPVPVSMADGWRMTRARLEELDELPAGLMLTSPANPTGVVLTREEIKGVVEWCAENGVRLISDEIYHGLTFGVEPVSALEFTRDAVVVNSFSKFCSMTGHRVGWLVLPDNMVEVVNRLNQNTVISVPTLSQIAARAALSDADSLAELRGHVERYRRNRDILLGGLDKRLIGNAPPPEGAFYLYLDISAVSEDSLGFARRLLEKKRVATVPGLDFDPDYGHRTLRLSFAGSEADMREAVTRINAFIAEEYDG